jgi:hypothetical protein
VASRAEPGYHTSLSLTTHSRDAQHERGIEMIRPAFIVLTGALLATSACHPNRPAGDVTPQVAESSDDSIEVALAQPVEFKLEDPGAEPRRRLRYHFAGGASWSSVLEMRMAMAMSVEGQVVQDMALPTLRMSCDQQAQDPSGSGHLRYNEAVRNSEFIADPGVPGELVSKLNAALSRKQQHYRLAAEVTHRGFLVAADAEPGIGGDPMMDELNEQFRRSLSEVLVPLPREAVGVGARWTVTSPMQTPMMTVRRSATYTLAELTGDQGVLTVSGDVQVPRQRTTVKTQEGTVEVLIKSARVTVSGESRLDLSRPHGYSDMRIDMQMGMDMSKGREHAEGTMLFRLRLRSRPATGGS